MPPVLASVWRGGVREAVIRGHVAVATAAGEVIGSAGDPEAMTTLRSCVKPIQALPFVRLAAAELGVTEAEVAIACASHQGENVHLATVRGLLSRAGVSESALGCGPQLPYNEEAARRLLASGGTPQPIHNNCSGKHAAMLATCAVMGWPLDGYKDEAHPGQQAVTRALEEMLGLDLARGPKGIDGCGLTTYGTPLAAIARGFAAAGTDPAFQRCQDAMAANPHLIAGTRKFDTALLAEAGTRVTAKIGGAAVWAAVLRPGGPGIAIKLEAGAMEAMPVAATAVLQQLGVFTRELPASLRGFATLALHNWAGTDVGHIRAEHDALRSIAPIHLPEGL